MEKQIEKQQYKQYKAIGRGYPFGYKKAINEYAEMLNSKRFEQYRPLLEERKQANELLFKYDKLVKTNWKLAKAKIVVEALDLKEKSEKYRLLYGMDSQTYNILKTKIKVLEFMCMILPNLEEGDEI